MTATLQSLPTENIKRILSFVGNVKDFHSLERVSKRLRTIIKDDDELWKSCEQHLTSEDGRKFVFVKDERLKTNRELSCVTRVLNRIKWYQTTGDNLILSAFGDDYDTTMARLVERILHFSEALEHDPHHEIHLRFDTTHCLSEILQTFLITYFQKANKICIECCPENEYPKLMVKHLALVDRMVGKTRANGRCEFFDPWNTLDFSQLIVRDVPSKTYSRIIRTAAYRAGVVMMEDRVFNLSWVAILSFLERLLALVLPIVEHEHLPAPVVGYWKRRRLSGRDTPRDVSPHVRFLNVCECGDIQYQITPVPRQFEVAAAKIRPSFPFRKVYPAEYDRGKPMCSQCGLESHGDSKCQYIHQDDSSASSVEEDDDNGGNDRDNSSISSSEDEEIWLCEDEIDR